MAVAHAETEDREQIAEHCERANPSRRRKPAVAAPNGIAGQAKSGKQGAARQEAEPQMQRVPRQEPGNENAQQQPRCELDVAADERAFQMRSEGMTYRQIGKKLGVNGSVAHRRVKRHAMRQKMYLNERLEEARDFELEKLRQMEQAILPDATCGNHASIKLVLRIMEMRRKLLKDVPLDSAKDLREVPTIEDTPEMLEEVVNAEYEMKNQRGTEEHSEHAEFEVDEDYPFPTDRDLTPEEEEQFFADIKKFAQGDSVTNSDSPVDGDAEKLHFQQIWSKAAEAVSQRLAGTDVTSNDEPSKKESKEQSKDESTSRMEDRKEAEPLKQDAARQEPGNEKKHRAIVRRTGTKRGSKKKSKRKNARKHNARR